MGIFNAYNCTYNMVSLVNKYKLGYDWGELFFKYTYTFV